MTLDSLITKMVENQESAGQDDILGGWLPKLNEYHEPIDRAVFEAIGIRFGRDIDELLVEVDLPAGWKLEAVDNSNSYWSRLTDSKGKEHALIFYKAAFYDRRAHIRLVSKE